MPQEFEITARREVPGQDKANPRALSTVIFYRRVGGESTSDWVMLPSAGLTDAKIAEAITAKEREKAPATLKRVTIQ
jgi:hypothetical protein